MALTCKHFLVSGKVQGVFYRATTQKKAIALGLSGWVRNLKTGEVELLAQGDALQISILEKWLQNGPPLACVEKVTCLQALSVDPTHTDFLIYPNSDCHDLSL